MNEPANGSPSPDALVASFIACYRNAGLFPPGHNIIREAISRLLGAIQRFLASSQSVVIGTIGKQFVVGDTPVSLLPMTALEVADELDEAGASTIAFHDGATAEELETFFGLLTDVVRDRSEPQPLHSLLASRGIHHVVAGPLVVPTHDTSAAHPPPPLSGLYAGVLESARSVFGDAEGLGSVDLQEALNLSDTILDGVASCPSPLMMLTDIRSHDDYTFTHAVNVSVLTVAQARQFDLPSQRQREVAIAELLHDVGKLEVPGEIIRKPGKLTDEEFGMMKKHPFLGAKYLSRSRELGVLPAIVALEHHMHYQDGGYPRVSSQRPRNLCSLLASIADVYDALRTVRPYRGEMPQEKVRSILLEGRGTQFEPNLLDRFMGIVELGAPVMDGG